MRVCRLGIAGGCLSHQPGIPFSRLYHQVLSRRLQDAYAVRLRSVIDHSFASPLDQRLTALAGRETDLVLVHVRSVFTVNETMLYRRDPQPRSDDDDRPRRDPRSEFGSRDGYRADWLHEGNAALGVLLGRHRRSAPGR